MSIDRDYSVKYGVSVPEHEIENVIKQTLEGIAKSKGQTAKKYFDAEVLEYDWAASEAIAIFIYEKFPLVNFDSGYADEMSGELPYAIFYIKESEIHADRYEDGVYKELSKNHKQEALEQLDSLLELIGYEDAPEKTWVFIARIS